MCPSKPWRREDGVCLASFRKNIYLKNIDLPPPPPDIFKLNICIKFLLSKGRICMKNNKLVMALVVCAILAIGIGIYYKNSRMNVTSDEQKALIFANYVEAKNRVAAGDVNAQMALERITEDAHELGISDEELEEAFELYTAA
jgi:hypothetical protein